jgi:hypothetical protein
MGEACVCFLFLFLVCICAAILSDVSCFWRHIGSEYFRFETISERSFIT